MEIMKATVRKSNERYDVFDTDFDNMIISATVLNPMQTTMGHKHPHKEFYFIVSGRGFIEIDTVKKAIETGDTMTVQGDQFHKLHNNTEKPLIAICAWEKADEA